ncbi:hypothetical protein R6Q57_022829 [Mikania cordata]
MWCAIRNGLKGNLPYAAKETADSLLEINCSRFHAPEIPNFFVKEEYDVEVVSSKPSDEDDYEVKLPDYEDVLTGEEPDMDFDFEMETKQVENDPPEQVNLVATENLEALLEHVKRSVGNPSSAPSFIEPEQPLDVAADLEPRNRRRYPRPWIHEDEPIDIVKLQSKVFELEQHSPSHKLLIQELKIDNELKDKKIKDLETNMGHLSVIVLELKKKLPDKFKGEFVDESSPLTTSERAPEISQAEFDELRA